MLRQVSLRAGDTVLELLEYERPPSDTPRPLASNNLGASHVAFLVDEVDARKAELEAKGVEFYSDSNVVDEGVLAGWRWVYFEDPDGYPLELVEVAYEQTEERARGIAAYLTGRARHP
jgi:catechol 2,3-dioxygenase-like lactoylglutathione lyase family enzyme